MVTGQNREGRGWKEMSCDDNELPVPLCFHCACQHHKRSEGKGEIL